MQGTPNEHLRLVNILGCNTILTFLLGCLLGAAVGLFVGFGVIGDAEGAVVG